MCKYSIYLSNNKANVAGKINVTEQEFVFDGFEMWKVLNIFAISGKCWLRTG